MWGIWGSHYTIPKAIFYLLKRDLYSGSIIGGMVHGGYGSVLVGVD